MKMLKLHPALLMLVLSLSTLAFPVAAERTPPIFKVDWIDDTTVIVTNTASGEQHQFKVVVEDTVKIAEIDGVPQNSDKAFHPLIFKFREPFKVYRGQANQGVRGAEAGIIKGLWSNSFHLWFGGSCYVDTYQIHLDYPTAVNYELAAHAILALTYKLIIELAKIGVSAGELYYLARALAVNYYYVWSTVYPIDTNRDGSFDIWLVTEEWNVNNARRWYELWAASPHYWMNIALNGICYFKRN